MTNQMHATHPGGILKGELEELNLSANAFAEALVAREAVGKEIEKSVKPSLVELLRTSPLVGCDLDIAREHPPLESTSTKLFRTRPF